MDVPALCMGRVAGRSLFSPTPESERSATSIEPLDGPDAPLLVKVRRTDRDQNSFERKNDTATAPGAAQTIRSWLLVWSPKIGSVTENMNPVAEKTQSTARGARHDSPQIPDSPPQDSCKTRVRVLGR